MNDIVLKLIMFFHVLVVLFVVLVPFLNNAYLLLLHSIFIPFMMLHWLMNDNTCALTLAEQHLRQQITGRPHSTNECFVGQFIEPIYDFNANNKDMSSTIYIITIVLWLTSVIRLYGKYKSGEIRCLADLMK